MVVPLAGLLLLAGCTAGPDGEASSSAGASLSTVAVAPPATANESPLPDNPAESVPAATSGPLSGADLPEASALGHGWVAVAEDGGVEEGPGNGTPFQQRDVAEIGEVVVPLGCEQRSGTTTPAHALQVTYAQDEERAVALLLEFDTASDAQAFAASRLSDLLACEAQPVDPFSGAEAPVRSAAESDGVVSARYRLADQPDVRWRSAQWVDGARVLILDASAPVDLQEWPTRGAGSPG